MKNFDRALAVALVTTLVTMVAFFVPPSRRAEAQRTGRAVFPRGLTIEDDGNLILECPGALSVCATAGGLLRDADGNAQAATKGLHWISCSVEDCFLCENATACADPDGHKFPAGYAGYHWLVAGNLYGYSTGGAGVLRIAKVTTGP